MSNPTRPDNGYQDTPDTVEVMSTSSLPPDHPNTLPILRRSFAADPVQFARSGSGIETLAATTADNKYRATLQRSIRLMLLVEAEVATVTMIQPHE